MNVHRSIFVVNGNLNQCFQRIKRVNLNTLGDFDEVRVMYLGILSFETRVNPNRSYLESCLFTLFRVTSFQNRRRKI